MTRASLERDLERRLETNQTNLGMPGVETLGKGRILDWCRVAIPELGVDSSVAAATGVARVSSYPALKRRAKFMSTLCVEHPRRRQSARRDVRCFVYLVLFDSSSSNLPMSRLWLSRAAKVSEVSSSISLVMAMESLSCSKSREETRSGVGKVTT